MELTFRVLLDPTHPGVVPDAVSFETGATPNQVGPLVYEHHGEGFEQSPGALTKFYEDLVSGLPMPLTLALHRVNGIDTVLATALFLQRDLALRQDALALVASADLVHRKGLGLNGHLDADLAGFFRAIERYFPSSISVEETGIRLRSAVEWVRDYLVDQRLPNLGTPPPQPRILDVGTNGFVLASTSEAPQIDSWFSLYSQGFLRGLIVGPELEEGRRQVIASKKSPLVSFDLVRAAGALNDLEQIMGGPPGWHFEEGQLVGPPQGTTLLLSHLVEVFLRV